MVLRKDDAMKVSGFRITWKDTNAREHVDCLCLLCLPDRGSTYGGDYWAPVYDTENNAWCNSCGKPMTLEAKHEVFV